MKGGGVTGSCRPIPKCRQGRARAMPEATRLPSSHAAEEGLDRAAVAPSRMYVRVTRIRRTEFRRMDDVKRRSRYAACNATRGGACRIGRDVASPPPSTAAPFLAGRPAARRPAVAAGDRGSGSWPAPVAGVRPDPDFAAAPAGTGGRWRSARKRRSAMRPAGSRVLALGRQSRRRPGMPEKGTC